MQEDEQFSEFVTNCLQRHFTGDWGDVCEEDKEANEQALTQDLRLLSSYNYDNASDVDDKIWIITEADHTVTTVLFPSEY